MPGLGRLAERKQPDTASTRTAISSSILFVFILGAAAALERCDAAVEERTCENIECKSASEGLQYTFSHPKGLFAQEHKSARLRQPGQQPAFGALLAWPDILDRASGGSKLLHLIRHGQAVSNAVQAYVGEDAWKEVTTGCSWVNASSGAEMPLYDPPLTQTGQAQAQALHDLLKEGSTKLQDLIGTKKVQIVVSPLVRTLQTYGLVLGGLNLGTAPEVDEFCRERFGHNTCDARRPATTKFLENWSTAGTGHAYSSSAAAAAAAAGDPLALNKHVETHPGSSLINCPVDKSLTEKFPGVAFPIAPSIEGNKLGLVSNRDTWWSKDDRESEQALRNRARAFLTRIFDSVEADVVFVVSHSGMIGAILAAVGREAYPAQNAELVPAIVTRTAAS